jgi:hypothetical protein
MECLSVIGIFFVILYFKSKLTRKIQQNKPRDISIVRGPLKLTKIEKERVSPLNGLQYYTVYQKTYNDLRMTDYKRLKE